MQVKYDLLVAADGAGSVVRAQLAKRMPEGFVRRIKHTVVYSTVGVSPPADQVPDHAFFQVHQFEVRKQDNMNVQAHLQQPNSIRLVHKGIYV